MKGRGPMWRLAQIWNHPANRGRRARAIVKGLGWRAYKRVFARSLEVRFWGDVRVRCYPDSSIATLLIDCHGLPDYHEMMFMRHYLRSGDGFVDVGANLGLYALFAASLVGHSGRVYAFEPGPVARQRLQENASSNGLSVIKIHSAAVGAASGRVRLVRDADVLNRIVVAPDDATGTVEVECVRLDDALFGESYALGKMDIEGAEPLALRGAERMLGECNPRVWLLEMNGMLHDYGFQEAELEDWLADRGYELAVYDSDRRELLRIPEPWKVRDNVLAIARAQWQVVCARVAPPVTAR